jgi:hypothetical protein
MDAIILKQVFGLIYTAANPVIMVNGRNKDITIPPENIMTVKNLTFNHLKGVSVEIKESKTYWGQEETMISVEGKGFKYECSLSALPYFWPKLNRAITNKMIKEERK